MIDEKLGILMSIHKDYIEKIFSGFKPFAFRKSLPKDFGVGTKLYFYETSKNGGRKMVVGEATVSDYFYLLSKDGKYPCFGAYNFIEYYMEKIKGDKETADKYRSVKEEFKDKFENYKYGFIINYALSEENLENIREKGQPINTWEMAGNYINNPLLSKILNDVDRSSKYITECDEWLEKLGFYDRYGESDWKYAIKLDDVIEYKEPILLSDLNDRNGVSITRAPQSWMYCEIKNR